MIRIELSHPGGTYTLDEAVAGEVHWAPEKATKYKSVKVTLGWHTEGRGSRDQLIVDEHSVPGGETDGATPLVVPFSLKFPIDGPMSYDGNLIRIIWTLTAEADEPWKLGDDEVKQVLQVGPARASR